MEKIKSILLIFIVMVLPSCEKKEVEPDLSFEAGIKSDGVFIINEGNYLAGNGSLSFYSYDTGLLYNDIFSTANGRPVGDVPNSMMISGSKGYIVVNNSGSIEVIDINSIKSLKTITGLVSPRNMIKINDRKAYVSSLYSNSLAIVDLISNSVSGHINIRHTSEAMVLSGAKAYVSSWSPNGKYIMILNTITDEITDSIEVAPEPESMVLDKNNKLWVLCSGGYTGISLAELLTINTVTDEIEKRFVFPSKLSYPSNLQINATKDTVYYLDNGIYRMGILSPVLSDKPFRPSNGRYIYKLGIDSGTGRIFYTDALDFQQRGYVLQVSSKGVPVDSSRADIIPGSFCFK